MDKAVAGSDLHYFDPQAAGPTAAAPTTIERQTMRATIASLSTNNPVSPSSPPECWGIDCASRLGAC